MLTRTVIALSCVTLPSFTAAAQHSWQPPVQTVGERVCVTHSAGLEPRDGGLFGGGNWYRARFTMAGMRFEPALGSKAPTTQHLALTPVAVRRGAADVVSLEVPTMPQQRGLVAAYARSAQVTERFDATPDGVELSWHFAQPLPGEGDLVVRYSVDTSLPRPRTERGGLTFEMPGIGGVHVGGVTGVDARGAKTTGGVRWTDGCLELSLPSAFVAAAHYPLVLDPLIGTVFGVETSGYDDTDPDVAYDASTSKWLAVWLRTFSATDADVRGQRLNNGGTLAGGTIYFASSGRADRPRLANLGSRDRFGVVWTQQIDATEFSVRFAAVAAATGTITHNAVITDQGITRTADIGCETDAPIGAGRDFVVVFDREGIHAHRVWFTSADTVAVGAEFSIDVPSFAFKDNPALSRTASSDGRLLLAFSAASFQPPTYTTTVVVLRTYADGVLASGQFVCPDGTTAAAVDVDGRAGRWVVASANKAYYQGFSSVTAVPVAYDNGSLTMGAGITFGTALFGSAHSPAVAFTPGRTWLGYRSHTGFPSPQEHLRLVALDSSTCTNCNDAFVEAVGSSEDSIAVATMTSGGLTSGEDTLAVFGEAGNVYAQRLRNHSNAGTITILDGACGSGGQQFFSHNPAIGSSGIQCSLLGLPPTASATTFNFSPVVTPTDCGTCRILPEAETTTCAILPGNWARAELPIPCLPSLVGTMFETQWITMDATQSPCASLPGIAVSARARLTIGQ